MSIAYWTLGQGDPIVDMGAPPFSHIQIEWEIDEIRNWYEMLAADHQLIRFDGRGTGLSDREIAKYSLEGMVRDLEAVVDDLDLPRFVLWGSMNSGWAAVTYAARRPDRISQLVLWCTYARGTDFFDQSGNRTLRAMIDQDWRMFVDTAARSRFVWSDEELAKQFAKLILAAVEPRIQAALMDALHDADVTDLLPSIRVPVLVMQREDRGVEVARRIASGIPNARLALFKGGSAAPYPADAEAVLRTVKDFLAEIAGAAETAAVAPVEPAELSSREREVLRLISQGKSNPEIAAELFISRATVQNHVSRILTKANLANRAQAAAYAQRYNLV